jgi:hypothetical protein
MAMSIAESRGQLSKATKDLMSRWGEVRAQWQDAQAERFEHECILYLESEVRRSLAAMDHMNVVLQRIIQDCE